MKKMGKNFHILIGLTDVESEKLQLQSKKINENDSPLSANSSGAESDSSFQIIKRLDSKNKGLKSDGSIIKNFEAMAEKLQLTAASDHSIKSNLDGIINLIRGFQPTMKERSQLIYTWKVK